MSRRRRSPLVSSPPAVLTSSLESKVPERPALGSSSLVALGILGSRITGLLRERVIGHYFGLDSVVADAFRQAVRIPNLLNNLLGEGVLSASFVTVYSKLRALREDDEADDLAAAVFSLLGIVCGVLVAAGILLAPLLVYVLAPGFKEEGRAITVRLVRILFPSTGFLVMSAWCLGVLNSHRKFLLSYLAPVVLNITVVVITIWAAGTHNESRLVLIVAWSFVLGNALTFAVQMPTVLKLLPDFQPYFEWRTKSIQQVISNFGPAFISRGVVQLSAFVDSIIASLLPTGSVAAFGYAQVIAIMPVSLFSVSVSAAELPALASAVGTQEEVAAMLRTRMAAGLRRIAFFIVPSAAAFLILGDVLAAALYQSGKFKHEDAVRLWAILAGSAIGLLATSLGRLYSSAFYALLDTRTPLRFAIWRVSITSVLGLVFALFVPKWLGIDTRWGVAGLTASAGMAGWVEFALLRRALRQRIGEVGLSAAFTVKLWSVALLSAIAAYFLKPLISEAHPILRAAAILPVYGALYFSGTFYLQINEAASAIRSVTRRLGFRS